MAGLVQFVHRIHRLCTLDGVIRKGFCHFCYLAIISHFSGDPICARCVVSTLRKPRSRVEPIPALRYAGVRASLLTTNPDSTISQPLRMLPWRYIGLRARNSFALATAPHNDAQARPPGHKRGYLPTWYTRFSRGRCRYGRLYVSVAVGTE